MSSEAWANDLVMSPRELMSLNGQFSNDDSDDERVYQPMTPPRQWTALRHIDMMTSQYSAVKVPTDVAMDRWNTFLADNDLRDHCAYFTEIYDQNELFKVKLRREHSKELQCWIKKRGGSYEKREDGLWEEYDADGRVTRILVELDGRDKADPDCVYHVENYEVILHHKETKTLIQLYHTVSRVVPRVNTANYTWILMSEYMFDDENGVIEEDGKWDSIGYEVPQTRQRF